MYACSAAHSTVQGCGSEIGRVKPLKRARATREFDLASACRKRSISAVEAGSCVIAVVVVTLPSAARPPPNHGIFCPRPGRPSTA